uniref:Protein sleepless n=1 Tax=Strigamia maritima TaxID=126957 RepID=T1J121_STRMM
MMLDDSIMLYLIFLFLFFQFQSGSCVIRCYNCNNTEPTCDWDTEALDCPDDDDLCVTIAQTRGDVVEYLMGCLSRIDDFRMDIPFRRYPGCRPAKSTVNDSMLYDEVIYCFCRFVDDCSTDAALELMVDPWVPVLICPDWGGIWCYRCVSTQPGCGEFNFDWRWHWQWTCPRDDDKCVKVIERKGADTLVTRECLSNLEGIRRDIPSDRYEGCRPAAKDVKLGNYVFNDIKELDVKRYKNTQ